MEDWRRGRGQEGGGKGLNHSGTLYPSVCVCVYSGGLRQALDMDKHW